MLQLGRNHRRDSRRSSHRHHPRLNHIWNPFDAPSDGPQHIARRYADAVQGVAAGLVADTFGRGIQVNVDGGTQVAVDLQIVKGRRCGLDADAVSIADPSVLDDGCVVVGEVQKAYLAPVACGWGVTCHFQTGGKENGLTGSTTRIERADAYRQVGAAIETNCDAGFNGQHRAILDHDICCHLIWALRQRPGGVGRDRARYQCSRLRALDDAKTGGDYQ